MTTKVHFEFKEGYCESREDARAKSKEIFELLHKEGDQDLFDWMNSNGVKTITLKGFAVKRGLSLFFKSKGE